LMDFPEPSGRDAAADGSVVGRSSLRRRGMIVLSMFEVDVCCWLLGSLGTGGGFRICSYRIVNPVSSNYTESDYIEPLTLSLLLLLLPRYARQTTIATLYRAFTWHLPNCAIVGRDLDVHVTNSLI
jgi:hypothetical protein